MKNFMTAGTEIQGLVEKRAQIIEKIANELSEAILSRVSTGKVDRNITKDILNPISELPVEEQRDILLLVSYKVASQSGTSGRSRSGNSGRSSMNDIFSSRNF